MKKKTIIAAASGFALLVLITIVAVALHQGGQPAPSASKKIKVVAAENFWGNIAAQIGGDHAEVTSLINDSSADPHLYESGAKDASALGAADIVIINGLGYDDFMNKLISAAPNNKRIVINVSNVLRAKEGDNPHLWYDVNRVSIVATEIMQKLADKDAPNADSYRANFSTFLTQLIPMLDTLQSIRSSYPQVPVAYTERLPGYLLASAGLTNLTPAGFASAIENGNEPSPADQAAMLSLLSTQQIKVLFYNAQADSPAAAAIKNAAEKYKVKVVAITETIPSSYSTYQAWQQAQIMQLKQALEAK